MQFVLVKTEIIRLGGELIPVPVIKSLHERPA